MGTLHSFKDNRTYCFANIRMNNGDPCFISVAQTGVIVKKSKLGLFGAKLYDERNIYVCANTAKALAYLFNKNLTPGEITNPVLRSFANAALHCSTLCELTRVLNEAIKDAEVRSGGSITELVVMP